MRILAGIELSSRPKPDVRKETKKPGASVFIVPPSKDLIEAKTMWSHGHIIV